MRIAVATLFAQGSLDWWGDWNVLFTAMKLVDLILTTFLALAPVSDERLILGQKL